MKYNILIIDDNEIDLDAFENIFKDINCNVLKARAGQEALEIIQTSSIALIILNAQMPGMDGYAIAEAIKETKLSTNVPIIFVSDVYKDQSHIFRAYEVGAVDYLFKPVDPFIVKHKAFVFLKLFEYETELENRLTKLEENNQEMNKLYKQINEYAKQLEIKSYEAEKANKAKSLFLANISHEIRTPMNAILGFTDILYEDEFDPVKKGKLRIIKQSGEFLLNLINDILDLSKIEAGKLEVVRSHFSLLKLFEEMFYLFSETAKRKNLQFSIDLDENVPEFVYGDERYLKQVFINLIGNSFKFTEKGKVNIKGEFKENALHLLVTDTGIGIDKEDLKKIFDAFKQVNESKTSKYKGTGLGLTISKSLIELMGGELEVSSVIGKGSSFRIYVPLTPSEIRADSKFVIPGDTSENEEMVQKWLSNFESEPLLKNILLRAIKSMPARVVALEASVEKSDLKEIEFMAHTIKGFSGSVRMEEISILARNMEMEAKKNDYQMEKIRRHLQEMKDIVNRIPSRYKETEASTEILQKSKSQLRILVAEDDDVNQEIIKAFLFRMGFACDIAENGKVALEKLKAKKYDILLLDIGMPVMDGMETIGVIRSLDELKGLRVIALTAYSMKGDKEKFLSAGFNDYISKPVDRNKLWEKIWK